MGMRKGRIPPCEVIWQYLVDGKGLGEGQRVDLMGSHGGPIGHTDDAALYASSTHRR